MTCGDEFDDALAAALVESLSELRRRLDTHCHTTAQSHHRLRAWSGPAHDVWSDGLDACLADGLEIVDALASTIDDIEERRARWTFDTHRMWGTGR